MPFLCQSLASLWGKCHHVGGLSSAVGHLERSELWNPFSLGLASDPSWAGGLVLGPRLLLCKTHSWRVGHSLPSSCRASRSMTLPSLLLCALPWRFWGKGEGSPTFPASCPGRVTVGCTCGRRRRVLTLTEEIVSMNSRWLSSQAPSAMSKPGA